MRKRLVLFIGLVIATSSSYFSLQAADKGRRSSDFILAERVGNTVVLRDRGLERKYKNIRWKLELLQTALPYLRDENGKLKPVVFRVILPMASWYYKKSTPIKSKL